MAKKRTLKKKLDKYFSRYIRLKYADQRGYVHCFTCSTKKHWKKMQCGHYVSRQHLITRWDEDNCRPQDARCNVFHEGEKITFREKLLDQLGEDELKKLEAKRFESVKLSEAWYEEKIDYYKEKVDELKEKLL